MALIDAPRDLARDLAPEPATTSCSESGAFGIEEQLTDPIHVLLARVDDRPAERFVAAFPQGDELVIPLDATRPVNRTLLRSRRVMVVAADRLRWMRPACSRMATTAELKTLERLVGRDLSIDTRMLRLTPEAPET